MDCPPPSPLAAARRNAVPKSSAILIDTSSTALHTASSAACVEAPWPRVWVRCLSRPRGRLHARTATTPPPGSAPCRTARVKACSRWAHAVASPPSASVAHWHSCSRPTVTAWLSSLPMATSCATPASTSTSAVSSRPAAALALALRSLAAASATRSSSSAASRARLASASASSCARRCCSSWRSRSACAAASTSRAFCSALSRWCSLSRSRSLWRSSLDLGPPAPAEAPPSASLPWRCALGRAACASCSSWYSRSCSSR
mmetsp:Transcript_1145/g.3196  ORF Transcript_1145/g.3196 Transcript_1145/m.3196 type:complete len:260 (+) Transcript_1145:343-1122(+)